VSSDHPGQSREAVDSRPPEVSIVIPVHNESGGLDFLFDTLLPIVNAATSSFEILLVTDGSSDDTLARLLRLQRSMPQLRVIDLSRNFGKEAALTAGLWHCRGACAITLDADLQDPPELIPQMLAKWREGFETVVAVHADRNADTVLRRGSARAFYFLLNAVSEMRFVPNAGDFRLLDRAVIEAFLAAAVDLCRHVHRRRFLLLRQLHPAAHPYTRHRCAGLCLADRGRDVFWRRQSAQHRGAGRVCRADFHGDEAAATVCGAAGA